MKCLIIIIFLFSLDYLDHKEKNEIFNDSFSIRPRLWRGMVPIKTCETLRIFFGYDLYCRELLNTNPVGYGFDQRRFAS